MYVDGSETRGALAAKVEVRYGSAATSEATLRVWAPQLPLTVEAADKRLSAIKGWRVMRGGGEGSGANKRKKE